MTGILPNVDVEIRRGGNAPAVVWSLDGEDGNPLPFAGRSFVLTIRFRGESIRKDSSLGVGLVADAGASALTWTPTLAESRLIPSGRIARYEIELREGADQLPILAGFIVGVGGLNDD